MAMFLAILIFRYVMFFSIDILSRPVTRGGAGWANLPRKFFSPLEKCIGYSLKILDIFKKIWAPLRKLFAPPGVPSWLRA